MIQMFDTAKPSPGSSPSPGTSKLSPGAQHALDTIATAVASFLQQPTIK
jgi:hypothetical protein